MSTFNILTPAEVRLLSKYSSWAQKANLAEKIEAALASPQFIGSFVDSTAADLSNHPGLAAGNFVPGDRYYDTTATAFKTNTATSIGPATWTTE